MDLSSNYYEGRPCPFATYGHNRDKEKGKTQINYGLLTDREGRPVSIHVYPDNTSDPNTVADQLQRVRQKFGIKKAIIIGDRGMLTSKQLDLAPAQRSSATKEKEQSKKTADGLHTVHSFRTLLENLGTLTKVICRPRIKGADTFLKFLRATPLQKEAFDLLGLKLPGA